MLFGFCALTSLPSFSGGCGGGNCSGNMQIAPWGPSNYQERPIYPMRGCGPNGCQKGWRSGIIYPPPTAPYGGQVVSSPPVGCGAPLMPPPPTCCAPPPACSGSYMPPRQFMPAPQMGFFPALIPPPGCSNSAPVMMMPPPPPQPFMPQMPAFREPVRGLW